MLFGLLFWDIIFAEVLGAFETPYQTAPLDLFYDSFYRARKGMIDERLQEIQDGKAREILEKHDNAHRDNAIICVGVNWEVCSKEDLLDIVNVRVLSLLCVSISRRSSSASGARHYRSSAKFFVKTMMVDEVAGLTCLFGTFSHKNANL